MMCLVDLPVIKIQARMVMKWRQTVNVLSETQAPSSVTGHISDARRLSSPAANTTKTPTLNFHRFDKTTAMARM